MNEPVLATRSAGAMLRAAREKQGLHIAALAAAIKVSPRKLEALEADRLSELPDATFTRALAQTMCRTLKIDARPVLELLPPAPSLMLRPIGGGLNAPFRERPGREDPGLAGAALRPMLWGAAVLVVAAALVYFLPSGLWKPQPAPAAETGATVAAAPALSPALTPAPGAAVEPEPLPAVAPSDEAASAAAAGPASAPPVVQAPAAAAPAPAPAAVAAVPAPTPAAAPPASGLVQLRSSAASWVEARDARGQVLLSRTVQPGESVGLDGSLPIRLTIGNAAATQLGFRGQPVDLTASTRDNVARVQLQ